MEAGGGGGWGGSVIATALGISSVGDACHDLRCMKGSWSAGGMFLGTATIQINNNNNTWGRGEGMFCHLTQR